MRVLHLFKTSECDRAKRQQSQNSRKRNSDSLMRLKYQQLQWQAGRAVLLVEPLLQLFQGEYTDGIKKRRLI